VLCIPASGTLFRNAEGASSARKRIGVKMSIESVSHPEQQDQGVVLDGDTISWKKGKFRNR